MYLVVLVACTPPKGSKYTILGVQNTHFRVLKVLMGVPPRALFMTISGLDLRTPFGGLNHPFWDLQKGAKSGHFRHPKSCIWTLLGTSYHVTILCAHTMYLEDMVSIGIMRDTPTL